MKRRIKYPRKISDAWEAWNFLYNHPKFCLRSRNPEDKDKALQLKGKGFVVTQDRNGRYWREWRHMPRHAIEENLSIFYAKVDGRGKVNDDPTLNTHVQCWLEFGSMEWDYASEWHQETMLMNYHDIDLDCGGKTFDEALVRLAKLVLKRYGSHPDGDYDGDCGPSPCSDCEDAERFRKRMMARIGKEKDARH